MTAVLELVDIAGRKKDGGGGGASEGANTLRSQQTARVLLLVSEGECGGLVNGLKSVYLDKVPVVNADNTVNYEGVKVAWRQGTQGQSAIDNFDSVESEVVVGQQIDLATPIVRAVATLAADTVRVTLNIPQLTMQDPTSGNVLGSEFEWAIDVQSNGTGFVEAYRAVVAGKNTSPYSHAVKVKLNGPAPHDVRVRRVSVDPPTTNIVNRFAWSSYTEITSLKLRHPNSAVVGLEIQAHPFGSMPEVYLDWLGQALSIPTNYNGLTRVYTGAWNGTFQTQWTNNPAWVFYNLVTNPRWGLGAYVSPALINKWTLYRIAQYCDEPVSNGRGALEPRFSINCQITSRDEAILLLRDVAAVFRAMVFWSNGGVESAQDAPGDASILYGPANAVDGLFNYADVSESTRHSVFICYWSDQAQFGKSVPHAVFDDALMTRYGLREHVMRPLGCTSRAMADRVCQWARYSEEMEGDIVTFTVGSDGVVCEPGRIFKIADPAIAGEQLAGRIHSGTVARVTLDRDVVLAVGETYTLSVQQPDPLNPAGLIMEERVVTTPAGTTRVIDVATPFSAKPIAETMWMLESTGIAASTWRCIAVTPVDGKSQHQIVAVAHNPSKYAFIEQGRPLDRRNISRLSSRPKPPGTIHAAEKWFVEGQSIRSRVTVSWVSPARGLSFAVRWRVGGAVWRDVPLISSNTIDLDDVTPGIVSIEVRSVNVLGNKSAAGRTVVTVVGGGKLAAEFRVIARSYSDVQSPVINSGVYSGAGSSATITAYFEGYSVTVIDRATGRIVSTTGFAVRNGIANAQAMAAFLNTLPPSRIVVVHTYGEPAVGRLLGGLAEAMYRCGASRSVFGSTDFRFNAAYVLVAIAGCGESQGYEAYQGEIESSPNAWTDVSFVVSTAGGLLVSGSSATPRTLRDYGYSGDMNATYGSVSSGNLLSNSEFAGRNITPAVIGDNFGGGTLGFFGSELSRIDLPTSTYIPAGTDALVINEGGRVPGGYIDVLLEGQESLPVSEGQRIEFSAWVQCHRCRVQLIVLWYASASSYLSPSHSADTAAIAGPGTFATLDNSFVRLNMFATAPPGARFMRVMWRKFTTDVGQPHSYAWLLHPYLGIAGLQQTVPSEYSPGLRLIDGLVGTLQVAPRAISSEFSGGHAAELSTNWTVPFGASATLLTFVPEFTGEVGITLSFEASGGGPEGNLGFPEVGLLFGGGQIVQGGPMTILEVHWTRYTALYRAIVTKGVRVDVVLLVLAKDVIGQDIQARNASCTVVQLKR